MIVRFLFHFICAIGRFFRKCLQLILGRRHEELSTSLGRTEPVTLEHIRIIGEMENDSNRPYQTLASSPKISQAEWNTWGAEDIFRQKQQLNNSLSAEKSEENVDYFSDIAATVKKTPKIIFKKRSQDNEIQYNSNNPSRLQMSTDELIDFRPDLSEWQDDNGHSSTAGTGVWNDSEVLNELNQEATEALRETRRIERERKLREHQQRKFEKEASRTHTYKRDSYS